MEMLVTGWLHRAGCTCWRPKSRCAKWPALLQRIEDQAADVDGYGYPAHGVHSFQPIVNPDSNGTEQGAVHGMICAVRSLANKYDRAGKVGQPSHKHPAWLANFAPEST